MEKCQWNGIRPLEYGDVCVIKEHVGLQNISFSLRRWGDALSFSSLAMQSIYIHTHTLNPKISNWQRHKIQALKKNGTMLQKQHNDCCHFTTLSPISEKVRKRHLCSSQTSERCTGLMLPSHPSSYNKRWPLLFRKPSLIMLSASRLLDRVSWQHFNFFLAEADILYQAKILVGLNHKVRLQQNMQLKQRPWPGTLY